MISHAKISRHRRMFKTLTGLSTEGFKQILPSFEEAWEADLDRRDAGRLRLRGRGGGRKGGPGGPQTDSCHPGVFPALPHPSSAGSALRDEPAAGQRVGSPPRPSPERGAGIPDATSAQTGVFEKGKREEVFGFPLKRWKGRFSLQTPFSVNFLTTTFSTLLSNWGAVLVFAKDRRPFLKAYDFRFVFSFTAITPEPHSTGGKAEVNR